MFPDKDGSPTPERGEDNEFSEQVAKGADHAKES